MKRPVIRNLGYWSFIFLLFGLSIYFATSVERYRMQVAKARLEMKLKPGATVTIVQVVDGDELTVMAEGDRFVVRLLGLNTFKSASYEPGISPFAQGAVAELKRVEGKKAVLQFENLQRDKLGRILAHVLVDKKDLGLTLIHQGLALTYPLVPFARERAYLAAETEASVAKRGLWSSRRASRRALALKAAWEAARSDA